MFYVVRWGDFPENDVIVGEFDTMETASVMWSEMQDLDPGTIYVVRSKEDHESITVQMQEDNDDIDFGPASDDDYFDMWDDDPNPHSGAYSEE